MHKTRRRFRGYDYARGGAMFVTTCLEPRCPLFGRVDHERVALSGVGEVVEKGLEVVRKLAWEWRADEKGYLRP